MADIQMRFGKDMLVLSTSFNHSFAQLGFDLATEEAVTSTCVSQKRSSRPIRWRR